MVRICKYCVKIENCIVGRPRGLLICSCSGLAIQTKQFHPGARGKYTGTYCPPFAGSLGQPAISTAPPGTFAHSLGRLAFQTSAVGWTNQADRLPWRPYGLIRANIISEDARKNRRISENSFGQHSLSFFSFLLPSFFLSSFLPSSDLCCTGSSCSLKKLKRLKIESRHVIIITFVSIACLACDNYSLFVHFTCLFNDENIKSIKYKSDFTLDNKS